MVQLTITAKGQVTLNKQLLKHMGVHAGDKLSVELLPEHQVAIRPLHAEEGIEAFFGILAKPDNPVLTIEEIKEITEKAWAGER